MERGQGITCRTFTAGLSTITEVTSGANVLDTYIVGVTGGLLYCAGGSIGVSAMVLGTQGAMLSSQERPIPLGVAPLYFSAKNSAVVVSIIQKLSAGFSQS